MNNFLQFRVHGISHKCARIKIYRCIHFLFFFFSFKFKSRFQRTIEIFIDGFESPFFPRFSDLKKRTNSLSRGLRDYRRIWPMIDFVII